MPERVSVLAHVLNMSAEARGLPWVLFLGSQPHSFIWLVGFGDRVVHRSGALLAGKVGWRAHHHDPSVSTSPVLRLQAHTAKSSSSGTSSGDQILVLMLAQ